MKIYTHDYDEEKDIVDFVMRNGDVKYALTDEQKKALIPNWMKNNEKRIQR